MRGRPEKWNISKMAVGDQLTVTPQQYNYVRQRFSKYKYKWKTAKFVNSDNVPMILCTREG